MSDASHAQPPRRPAVAPHARRPARPPSRSRSSDLRFYYGDSLALKGINLPLYATAR